ncbi:MAG: endolytic transglycosylase MltG [Bacteroidales bacterium]
MTDFKGRRLGMNRIFRIFLYLIVFGLVAGSLITFILWKRVFAPNITTGQVETFYLYIPTGTSYAEVMDLLDENNLVENMSSLEWVAVRKNYPNRVRPGKYRLTDGMSNNQLINMLRSGGQVPVKLVFNNLRTLNDIASVVSMQIEADSSSIAELAMNVEFIESIGFDTVSLPAMFIPNTYEIYWNTSAEQFYRRMKDEYDRFWNNRRQNKLQAIGLDRHEVSTLASIVIEETVKYDEMPVIAGVYLNRLERGMLLQADPTVKFALGDLTVRRILRADLQIDSPYNTYKYAGLPPGPIVIPPVQAIDAVLDAQNHDYIFFSAKEDFSGYHRFAKTLSEHNRNARLYQNALNRQRVFR